MKVVLLANLATAYWLINLAIKIVLILIKCGIIPLKNVSPISLQLF